MAVKKRRSFSHRKRNKSAKHKARHQARARKFIRRHNS
jgi:hypothetical protein